MSTGPTLRKGLPFYAQLTGWDLFLASFLPRHEAKRIARALLGITTKAGPWRGADVVNVPHIIVLPTGPRYQIADAHGNVKDIDSDVEFPRLK